MGEAIVGVVFFIIFIFFSFMAVYLWDVVNRKRLLIRAAKKGHLQKVKFLLDYTGVDVNVQSRDGRTALIEAVENGHHDVILLLLEAGADVNIQDSTGRTALHWIVRNGHHDIISLLLEAGADVNIQNRHGRTALWLAESKGNAEITQLLRDVAAKRRPWTEKVLGSLFGTRSHT